MILKRRKFLAIRLEAACARRAGLPHTSERFPCRKMRGKKIHRSTLAGLPPRIFRVASGFYPLWIYPIEPGHIMTARIKKIIETTRKAWKIEATPPF